MNFEEEEEEGDEDEEGWMRYGFDEAREGGRKGCMART
jgi:hypothetical protein